MSRFWSSNAHSCCKAMCQAVSLAIFTHMALIDSDPLSLMTASFATSGCLTAIDFLFTKRTLIKTNWPLKLTITSTAVFLVLLTWMRLTRYLTLLIIVSSCPAVKALIFETSLWIWIRSIASRYSKRIIATGMSMMINNIYVTSCGLDPQTTWITFLPYAKTGFATQLMRGIIVTSILRWTERYGVITPVL